MVPSIDPLATAVARLAVTVGFVRMPVASRWQDSAWRLESVEPADAGSEGQRAGARIPGANDQPSDPAGQASGVGVGPSDASGAGAGATGAGAAATNARAGAAGAGSGATGAGVDATGGALERVSNHATLPVLRDEAEGYWLNLTATEPSIFVLWRAEGAEAPRAMAASLSYNEAGRWMDAGEAVDRVPMPAEMIAWLTDWVNRTYEPQRRKRQPGQKPSFMRRDEFARFARGAADPERVPQGPSDEAEST